jgi:glutamine amidotransferase
VHSYHFVPSSTAVVLSTTNYDTPFVSAIGVDNIVATQFHPEKSQANGLKFLTNFVEWRP